MTHCPTEMTDRPTFMKYQLPLAYLPDGALALVLSFGTVTEIIVANTVSCMEKRWCVLARSCSFLRWKHDCLLKSHVATHFPVLFSTIIKCHLINFSATNEFGFLVYENALPYGMKSKSTAEG